MENPSMLFFSETSNEETWWKEKEEGTNTKWEKKELLSKNNLITHKKLPYAHWFVLWNVFWGLWKLFMNKVVLYFIKQV